MTPFALPDTMIPLQRGDRSSVGRASGCGPEGRGFKPRRSPFSAVPPLPSAGAVRFSGTRRARCHARHLALWCAPCELPWHRWTSPGWIERPTGPPSGAWLGPQTFPRVTSCCCRSSQTPGSRWIRLRRQGPIRCRRQPSSRVRMDSGCRWVMPNAPRTASAYTTQRPSSAPMDHLPGDIGRSISSLPHERTSTTTRASPSPSSTSSPRTARGASRRSSATTSDFRNSFALRHLRAQRYS